MTDPSAIRMAARRKSWSRFMLLPLHNQPLFELLAVSTMLYNLQNESFRLCDKRAGSHEKVSRRSAVVQAGFATVRSTGAQRLPAGVVAAVRIARGQKDHAVAADAAESVMFNVSVSVLWLVTTEEPTALTVHWLWLTLSR